MPRRKTLFARRDVAPRTFIGTDDPKGSVIRRDRTGGMNNRQHPSVIGETQGKKFQNIDLTIPGEGRRRPGMTLVEALGNNPITGMFGFDPQGASANLLATEGTNLKAWTGSGAFVTVKSDFTTGLQTTMIKSYKTGTGDVALVSNGTDNVFEMDSSYNMVDLGDTNTSPPLTPVMTTYRNRVWCLKNDLAYFSDASPSDYSAAFDRTTNYYRVPIGTERAIIATRDVGLIFAGKDQVWGLNPSTVPAATDKPEKLSEYGCAAGNTFVQVGDDYMYLTFDGVRALYRTNLDKLQYGSSLPASYNLKDEFESINWNAITSACAVCWDNKYFIALPVNGSTLNNQVWVYYPATKGWMVIDGWNVGKWAKFKVNGEERLYYGSNAGETSLELKDDDGLTMRDDNNNILYIDDLSCGVFRAWYGASDNGEAIHMIEEGRNEDLGYPLIKKYAGEFRVKAKPAGNYDISVYGSFDNGSYNLLGYLNVATSLITFPVTFPVAFLPEAESYRKFPLDTYGEWYSFRHKLEHNAVTTNADDINIYETSLTAIPQEYDPEEYQ